MPNHGCASLHSPLLFRPVYRDHWFQSLDSTGNRFPGASVPVPKHPLLLLLDARVLGQGEAHLELLPVVDGVQCNLDR